MRMKEKRLYIIVPCYNEEKALEVTPQLFLKELLKLIDNNIVSNDSRILFVDDGSNDDTWSIIQKLSDQDPHYKGIRQSRNRGHQNAVLAGLMEVKDICDITISIDCDGQDDISVMQQMVEEHINGSEVVYGVRSNRDTDSVFKKFTAECFYKFMRLLGAEVVFNHADYRLISSRVLQALSEYNEVNLFLRGLIPLIGFKSSSVLYERKKRMAGKSHYPLGKMIAFALEGITSLTIKPLRMIMTLGIIIALISFAGAIWSVLAWMTGGTVPGWSSMIFISCFLGGVQMICMGIIGEYVGKVYMEVKHRPRYIISERTGEDKEDNNGDKS